MRHYETVCHIVPFPFSIERVSGSMGISDKKSNVNTSRKRTQRSHALESSVMKDNGKKPMNRREKAILKAQAKRGYTRLGSVASCGHLAKNRKLDNRTFRVCNLAHFDVYTITAKDFAHRSCKGSNYTALDIDLINCFETFTGHYTPIHNAVSCLQHVGISYKKEFMASNKSLCRIHREGKKPIEYSI